MRQLSFSEVRIRIVFFPVTHVQTKTEAVERGQKTGSETVGRRRGQREEDEKVGRGGDIK